MCHAGLAFSLLDLPTVQESSAASHKCHFRVCHSGRVCDYPYKSVLMVDRALKAIPRAGSNPRGTSANACSSNGMRVRVLNLQFLATVARHHVARGARFERAIFDSRAPAPAPAPDPAPALYRGKGGCDAASSSLKEAIETDRTLNFQDGCPNQFK